MSKFLKAIVNIVLLVAILSAGALLIPPLMGITTKVSDGTGNTNLSRGSVTYATSAQASELETGDRILQDDSSGSYVYTVASIAADTSMYTLTDEVSGETQEQQLSGGVQKVALTLPVIGILSLTLQSREGIIILGLCVAFLIILFILSEVWRKDDEEDEDDDDVMEADEEVSGYADSSEDGQQDEDSDEGGEESSGDHSVEEPEAADEESAEEQEISEELLETMNQTDDSAEETEDMERSLADAVGALLRGAETSQEEESSGNGDSDFTVKVPEEDEGSSISGSLSEDEDETEDVPQYENITEQEVEEEITSEIKSESETDPDAPVELAMSVLTAEELLKKAEEAGDHPKVIEDKETGVTILDYSDIL